jgi:hypothetical protein
MERLPEDIGMRALAAALIPFVGATFLLVFRPAVFSEFLSLGNVAALACSLAIGFTIPFSSRLDHDLALPLSAFLFSAVFSVLTCSYAAVRDSRLFVVYYGFALGALVHVAFIGLPKKEPRS